MDEFHNFNYHGYTLEIHHGGSFKEEGGELLYSEGEISRWDIDPDKVSATHMMKELEKMGTSTLALKRVSNLRQLLKEVLRLLRELQKDVQTVSVREARQDISRKKGKEKEGAIVAVDAGDEEYITDYPSSNEACSINSGETSSEFGDDEDTVRKIFDNHTCNITYKNSRVNRKWLARHYMGTIRSLPSIKLDEFKKLVKEQLGVEVSRSQCRRAKEKVYDLLVGDSKAEYALMWFYADELKRTNRDSSVCMKVERPIPAEPPIFDRFYVCFDALKTGFVKGCRQIIGVDDCFLKTVVKGQLLTAIGRDGNNQIFPIAWAVVQVESRDTWLWFLSLLKEDLNITDGLGWSIISDQQKGLDPSDCVHSFYKKEMFLEAYGKVMEPVRDPKFWERTNMHEPPVPPLLKKKKGRPKKQRRKTGFKATVGKDGVQQMSRKGTTNTCSLCR
ncbi:hypothetical protein CRG98_005623 [Punica granatum]|uniref:Uncharacterized protein n=1 Tax=Punica granatum TaxID=22663 RepID=A0A2I0L1I9_PUNGR|nr:hypothetical protein CRG98_005623 [Punica granatum]